MQPWPHAQWRAYDKLPTSKMSSSGSLVTSEGPSWKRHGERCVLSLLTSWRALFDPCMIRCVMKMYLSHTITLSHISQKLRLQWPLPEGAVYVSLEEGSGEVTLAQTCQPSVRLLEHSLLGRWIPQNLGSWFIRGRNIREMRELSTEVDGGDSVSLAHRSHMSLFHFELIMLTLLGISLPVVYWRKIRVRHL